MHIHIPFKFKILHYDWVVRWEPKRGKLEENDCYGICAHDLRTIYISQTIKDKPDILLHTILHELAHAILTTGGYTELSDNEGFVDLISGLICQIIYTKKDLKDPTVPKPVKEEKQI